MKIEGFTKEVHREAAQPVPPPREAIGETTTQALKLAIDLPNQVLGFFQQGGLGQNVDVTV